MSYWTQIQGIIEVQPAGRTQAEKTYILETVLNHLPQVTGSEGNMKIYVNQQHGHNSWSGCDEYGDVTNNLVDRHGDNSREYGCLQTQHTYIITISSSLRDRKFDQTYREFIKWLTRFSKRIWVSYVDVLVSGSDKQSRVHSDPFTRFSNLDEIYNRDDEPRWIDHLMWKCAKDSLMPAELMYKYYSDEENDARVENYLRIGERKSK